MKKSIFDRFTRQYQLSKTLRFELVPVGKTAEFLKQNKVFEKDKLVDDHYHEIKYYFDILHREFINESLRSAVFIQEDTDEYREAVERVQKTSKEGKKKAITELKKIENVLRQKLVDRFNETANAWKRKYGKHHSGDVGVEFKKDGTGILFEESVLKLLKKKFPEKPKDDPKAPSVAFTDPETGERQNLFDSFKGFFTYLYNFNETKKNLYSEEDEDTAVANRAVNENFRKFIENVIQFENQEEQYRRCGLTDEELEVFKSDYYHQCLPQDGIDQYNRFIGGPAMQSGEKGINQKVNEYNQQHKGSKLGQFARLYKQIMSLKEKDRGYVEIEDDKGALSALKEFIVINEEKMQLAEALMDAFLERPETFTLEKVYVKGIALNTISQKWFSNWAAIRNLLGGEGKKKKRVDNEDGTAKLPDFVPVSKLLNALGSRSNVTTETYIRLEDLFREEFRKLFTKPENHTQTFLNIWRSEWKSCVDDYRKQKSEVEAKVVKMGVFQRESSTAIDTIRKYCDSSRAVYQMMKYFALEKGRKKMEPDDGADVAFYNELDAYDEEYPLLEYYNAFRNYLTAKPYLGRLFFPAYGDKREQRHPLSKRPIDGAEKIKLNFENGMLLFGWDKNKEPEYRGLIFREKDRYLFGLMTKDNHNLFKNAADFVDNAATNSFEKMEYRQLNNIFRQLPRIAFAKSNQRKYDVTDDLKRTREEFKQYQDKRKEEKTAFFDNTKLQGLISLYKKVLDESYGDDFDFEDVLSQTYNTLNDFFQEVERRTYTLKFVPVMKSYIDELVLNGKMFLFEITGKDFKKRAPSMDNLHTLYFKALFEPVDASDTVMKLSGGGEIFFRPKTDQLGKRKDRKGGTVLEHKRYGEDKVFLHIPIALNMSAGRDYGFNRYTNKCIAEDKQRNELKLIGIDRGENHLAYYALIDQNGKLLDSKPLNGELPGGGTYLDKLEERAKDRDKDRKEWQTIERIKDLKSGYISQTVRTIADLMIQENAVLVLEDLSVGFMRSRQKIEKQTYQQLEMALVKKLNYLVNKTAAKGEPGHYLNAYQLTSQVTTPKDIGKQCGFVFYVPPGYTSLTCPQCGYRKNTRFTYENVNQARKLIEDIDLHISRSREGFVIRYEIANQKDRKKNRYELSSDVIRYQWHRLQTNSAKDLRRGEDIGQKSERGVIKRYDIAQCIDGVIEDEKRALGEKQEYRPADLMESDSADFYRHLFRYLGLLLRSRNSVDSSDGTDEKRDYIQCPRCLYHSDDGFQGIKPFNGDANGAYNIARKGLLMLRKIQNASDPAKITWGDLRIDVEEWDKYVQRQWNPTSPSRP